MKMLQHIKPEFSPQLLKLVLFGLAPIVMIVAWGSLTDAAGQKRRTAAAREQPSAPVVEEPVFSDYKGVKIGMTADEARKKLGTPQDMSDTQDFYVFSEKETAQVFYDAEKKVKAISIDYMGAASGAPECKAIVGTDLKCNADGSMYKLVRYPKQGFWVSYNRTAGDTPTVSVTIQKSTP
jgi:hypothetical protein